MLPALGFLLFLIILNAFFAASEIALISVNDTKIRLMAEKGDKKAKLIQALLNEPGRFLATIQIGITLAGFLASAFASESFAGSLATLLKQIIPGVPQAWLKNLSVFGITIILSYVTLILGELVPKRLAMKNSEAIARFVASPLTVLYKSTYPFVLLLNKSTNFVVRMFGVNPEQEDENITEEEIRMMVSVGKEKGTIDETEKKMINNVFEFDNKNASEIMTHRIHICALPVTASYDEVIEVIRTEQYSRMPVYDGSIDNIKGILHIKDMLVNAGSCDDRKGFSIENIMRKPIFVPSTRKVDLLFKDMQEQQTHMVVIIDEYGGTAGIATIEDVLEEIVGNIQDEYDNEAEEIISLGNNEYLVEGTANLYDLRDYFDVDFPVEDFDTIGGLAISLIDKIPEQGEHTETEWDNFKIIIEEVQDKSVSKVRMIRKENKNGETLV